VVRYSLLPYTGSDFVPGNVLFLDVFGKVLSALSVGITTTIAKILLRREPD
jgi:hypothetical protein